MAGLYAHRNGARITASRIKDETKKVEKEEIRPFIMLAAKNPIFRKCVQVKFNPGYIAIHVTRFSAVTALSLLPFSLRGGKNAFSFSPSRLFSHQNTRRISCYGRTTKITCGPAFIYVSRSRKIIGDNARGFQETH